MPKPQDNRVEPPANAPPPELLAGALRAFLDEALAEIERGNAQYIEATQSHLNLLHALYRLLGQCIDAHEAGADDLAWSMVRRGMEKCKTAELEVGVILAALREDLGEQR